MTTLGYAILGLLSREDLSGYDLTRRMAGRVGYFWSARHSQIYPELARLEDGGYVTHSVVEQTERPDKKVYEITAEGLDALKDWVTRLFREEELRHEEQLAHYEGLRTWMEEEWREDLTSTNSPEFASYASLRRGISYEREYAEWCRWMAESIERRRPTD